MESRSSTNDIIQELQTEKQINKNEIKLTYECAEGLTSKIYYGNWNNQIVAVKQFKMSKSDENHLRFFNSEKTVLKLFADKNENKYIIKYHGYFEDEINHSLVLEFIEKDLIDHLKFETKCLTEEKIFKYASDVAHGLSSLHGYDIIHCDLKCENILVSGNDNLKLIDFGFCKFKKNIPDNYGLCGSEDYVAPELIAAEGNSKKGAGEAKIPYSEKSDMYAYAIVLFVINEVQSPYYGLNYNTKKTLNATLSGKRPFLTQRTSPFFSNLIKRCWDQNPEKRPNANDIITEIEVERNRIKM